MKFKTNKHFNLLLHIQKEILQLTTTSTNLDLEPILELEIIKEFIDDYCINEEYLLFKQIYLQHLQIQAKRDLGFHLVF